MQLPSRYSEIKEAEGLAGNQTSPTEYPFFGVGGDVLSNSIIPHPADQGTSTEALTASKVSSWVIASDLILPPGYPNNPEDKPTYSMLLKVEKLLKQSGGEIGDGIPELEETNPFNIPLRPRYNAFDQDVLENMRVFKTYRVLEEGFTNDIPKFQQIAQDKYHKTREYQLEHIEAHSALHWYAYADFANAYDDYIDARMPFEHPMFGGEGRPKDSASPAELAKLRILGITADHEFRKMHKHLHHICTRSTQKGGPCGYWGIPRSRENCEFCESGNPMRPNLMNNDGIFRFARPGDKLENTGDEWAVSGEDDALIYKPSENLEDPVVTSHPAASVPGDEIPLEPGEKPRTELPIHILEQIGDIQTFPEGWRRMPGFRDEDPSTLVGPVPNPTPLYVTKPHALSRINCFNNHFMTHIHLYNSERVAYTDYIRHLGNFHTLQKAIGDNPNLEQTQILAQAEAKVGEARDAAHEAYHLFHNHFHTHCPDGCGLWDNPRDPVECSDCKNGCSMCQQDDSWGMDFPGQKR